MNNEFFLIGQGILTWNAEERRSDRYGQIFLMKSGNSFTEGTPSYCQLIINNSIKGVVCELYAEVLESRQSTHIGDLFHQIFPIKPNVGDKIHLGIGYLSIEKNTFLRLKPIDGRDYLCMDIRGLYNAHEQTVNLIAKEVK